MMQQEQQQVTNVNLHHSNSNIELDRSKWVENALRMNPHIRDLRDRIKPLSRALKWGEYYQVGKQQVKETLDKSTIIQLVLQHLSSQGFEMSRIELERESGLKSSLNENNSSRLVHLMNIGMRNSEKVYDLIIDERIGKVLGLKKDRHLELEEHLLQLGMQEEEIQEEDVDIWNISSSSSHDLEVDTIIDSDSGEMEKSVKYGSLNGLVRYLTSISDLNSKFQDTFLLTFQSFTTTQILFEKLAQRFNVPPSYEPDVPNRNEIVKIIHLQVCKILKKWMDEYPSDFDENLKRSVAAFIHIIRREDEPSLATLIQTSLSKLHSNSNVKWFLNAEKKPEPIVTNTFLSCFKYLFNHLGTKKHLFKLSWLWRFR
eukprot:TRINITY_DN8433_c0_g1_i2.p1 TRINITY_DN8433_c0_g1~~TRINITY_DN8433_c0_g1_i2.p1  ORF type:complete len:371 (+),score=150.68 TRINITY_DN8433_c0_g1_i2:143-1255(+)